MTPFDLPGYKEAVQQEQLVRDAAWLDISENIGGFKIRPMTLRDYLTLRLLRNPLMFNQPATPHAIISFLWFLSPDYTPFQSKAKRLHVIRCLEFIPPRQPRVDFKWMQNRWEKKAAICLDRAALILAEIYKYIAETFQDWPEQGNSKGSDVPYIGEGVNVCTAFAREYGLSFKETMSLPMKIILQCQKEILIRSSGLSRVGNPSDRIKTDFLLNQRRN